MGEEVFGLYSYGLVSTDFHLLQYYIKVLPWHQTSCFRGKTYINAGSEEGLLRHFARLLSRLSLL